VYNLQARGGSDISEKRERFSADFKFQVTVFSNKSAQQGRTQEVLQGVPHEQIGRLTIELTWLKKSCPIRSRSSDRRLKESFRRSVCAASVNSLVLNRSK